MASPPFRSTRAMQASIASADTSLHATLAPYLASASATPLPIFGPTPVTSATLPSRDTSTVARSLSWTRFPWTRPRSAGPGRLGPADYGVAQAARQPARGTEDAGRRLGHPPTPDLRTRAPSRTG